MADSLMVMALGPAKVHLFLLNQYNHMYLTLFQKTLIPNKSMKQYGDSRKQ